MAMEHRGPAVKIEKATAADTPRLAQTLARAFYDDPTIRWMVPDDERRLRMGPLGFGAWLEKIYLPKDEVYTDPEPAAEQYRTKATLDRQQALALRLPQGGAFTLAAVEVLP